MKQYLSKEELKDSQMNILKFIDRVCKENDISYFVNYGTLLGAIRHKGFIPWDDDIDICLYREDYDRFLNVVKELKDERYKVLDYDSSDWYFQNFAVIVDDWTVVEDNIKVKPHDTSVFVDVFPVDRVNDLKVADKGLLMATLRMIAYIKLPYVQYGDSKLKDLCRKIMWYLLRAVNPRYFAKRIDRLVKKYSDPKGQYEGLIGCSKDGRKDLFRAGIFEELIEAPFEDMMVPIPKNYDEFLTQFYGNYMQIPSQEEIDYKSHGIKAYWKEK